MQILGCQILVALGTASSKQPGRSLGILCPTHRYQEPKICSQCRTRPKITQGSPSQVSLDLSLTTWGEGDRVGNRDLHPFTKSPCVPLVLGMVINGQEALHQPLRQLMWQELPPDSRANKKFANAIYHFKKPYVGGSGPFSAAARVIVRAEQPELWEGGVDDVFTKSVAHSSGQGGGGLLGAGWGKATASPQLSHSQEVNLG